MLAVSGETQRELAGALRISEPVISLASNGRTKPSGNGGFKLTP
jgi:hypothetical protein